MLLASESARTSTVTRCAYLAICTAAWPAALPHPTMNTSVSRDTARLRDAGPVADTAADELGHMGRVEQYSMGAQLGPVEKSKMEGPRAFGSAAVTSLTRTNSAPKRRAWS